MIDLISPLRTVELSQCCVAVFPKAAARLAPQKIPGQDGSDPISRPLAF
ncbi:hypothetical protein [Pacificitalea manganoxidans]|nr:hypothetical protein [Pacificitalea manganoxidans]MDR6309059.1 hypothetical protein [Pacificitalea manganoxidans]